MTLERKTELKPFSDKRLAQFGGRMPRSTLDKPGKKTAPKPKRWTDTGPDDKTVDAVLARADWKCESCGDELYGRRGYEYSIHHRKRRSQGGDNQPSNLVVLCGHGTSQCHGAAHSEIERARLVGFLLKSTEDPALVPVEHSWRGLVYLTDDGRAVSKERPMREIHPLLARLIEERKARGISQTAIAKHIGISKTAVCEMEHGHHEPRMRSFIGYAEALGFAVLPELSDEPGYPDEEAMAAIAAACTCPGCMTGGKCIDDPPDDGDWDDEERREEEWTNG